MARAYVELPEGWGPAQLVITAWRRAGYTVERVMLPGLGESRLLVNAEKPRRGGASRQIV